MPVKPIGQSMIEANLINQGQLDELLEYQRRSSERVPLGRLTVDLGLVKEEEFGPFIASYFNVPYVNLERCLTVQKEALDIVPESIAKRYNVFPLVKEDDTLTIAISDPLDLTTLENLEAVTHCSIKQVISTTDQIRHSITAHYTGIFLRPNEGVPGFKEKVSVLPFEKYKKTWPFISSLVGLLIEKAVNNNINLIHIQPDENRVKVFFRIDKKLEKAVSYPKSVFRPIVNFVKKASSLNLQKNDIPQAGYFVYSTTKLNVEIGVAIFPTLSGERMVLEVPRRIGWLEEDWFKSI